ncbi:ABC transporter permease subunit [Fictibacillus nanhaiensis]|uniref:ABC transporter permease n=1 Tax=Fictibacillus nanhaiensis TaxID=742169 RepID=UPI002E251D4B|nr:ABC transporter permease subunit [Fictibacillus nanhaiensis]MED1865933.1 ABC transporter permease subunit [Fictibacillus nanhaiensis]
MLSKTPLFFTGLFLLLFILIVSIVIPIALSEPEINPFRYSDALKKLEIPPYSPSKGNWLGTDRNGKDLFYILVDGAKYTILFACIITLARIFVSVILGLIFKRLFNSSWFSGLIQSFQYVPQSLIVLLTLSPFLFYEVRNDSVFSTLETLFLQLLVLIAVGVLPLGKIIAETAEQLSRTEYVNCSKLMGASYFQITAKHILPHLWPRLFVIGGRQFAQVLTLMLHLAIYHLFIGGVQITSGQEHDQFNHFATISNEWTGLISTYHKELMLEPFIVMVPVTAFALLVLCINLMTKDLEHHFSKRSLFK